MNIFPDWIGSTSFSSAQKGAIIEIEKGWQLLSIPIKNGYFDKDKKVLVHKTEVLANIQNYILDQIESVYGIQASEYISIANTYTGDNQFFYNYIPGVTNPLSTNNFNFVYDDNGNEEYVGFWIKSISETPFKIKWGEVGETSGS